MSRRVLVVDDEKLIVKGIRFSLEQDAATLITSESTIQSFSVGQMTISTLGSSGASSAANARALSSLMS